LKDGMRDIALIAELGHAACRFALLRAVEQGGPVLSHQWECEIVPGVTDVMDVIRHYIDGLDRPAPKSLSVAVAGAITGDRFTITSSGWTCSGAELRAAFGFERVLMLNETSARGLALDMMKPGEALPIGGREPLSTPLLPGRYALVSPDVGLGVCYVQVEEDGRSTMVGTEGGHMAFAAHTEFEFDLVRRLTKKFGRVSYERVISWSGLTEIHTALCDRAGVTAASLTPLEIILYSRTGADPLCVEATNVFFEILGDFAGDVAMALGASRGVFICGRFIAEAYEGVEQSRFRERFEAKGRLAGVVRELPTWAVVNRASVLNGMARHLIDTVAEDPDLADLSQVSVAAEPAPTSAPREIDAIQLADTILDGAGAGLLVLDSHLNIVSANDRYWTGASVPEALRAAGQPIGPCLEAMVEGRDLGADAAAGLLEQLQSGLPFHTERTAFGGRTLRDEAQPIPTGGWVITAQDISLSRSRATELEAIAADLRTAKTAADAASGAKTAFLATMSHEIRTPLNGILGMAQAMAIDELAPQQSGRLEIIRQSGETLLAILNDILDLSKIEAGKLEIEEVEFDLDQLLRGAHSTFTALANKKGLSFCLATDEGARGAYMGDPTRLRQVLYNLVSNAIKFTETGEVRVTTAYDGTRLSLTVTDTGIGIPQDRIDALFEKFMQVDVSTTRQYGGTGLGLAICRDLASLMGGAIKVTSEVGNGTAFELVLPLVRTGDSLASTGFAVPAEIETAEAGALRVLAAEDNSVNQLVLKTLLGQIGVEVTVVDDGEKAVAAWEAEDWDVILMDVQMPKMDGPTAVGVIRQREIATGRARTPIIALTANVMTHQINEYLAVGMDACVGKPLQITALVEAIIKVTEGEAEAASASEAA
jgi:glucokinase